jgi:PAS domain-containing protein
VPGNNIRELLPGLSTVSLKPMPIARTMLSGQMTDLILVIDPDGRPVDLNLAAERVLRPDRAVDVGSTHQINVI